MLDNIYEYSSELLVIKIAFYYRNVFFLFSISISIYIRFKKRIVYEYIDLIFVAK